MRLNASRRLLCSAIGMAVASQAQAAAIKLDAYVDGQPAAVTEVLLNGESIGGSGAGKSFWYDQLSGGRHSVQLRIAGETIPYEFSVSDTEAAVITVNRATTSGESTQSLQRIDLSRFETGAGGERVMIAPEAQEGLAPGLIQGTVLNGENEAPVRNVRVQVVGGEAQTTTDRYGNFELELPPGVYELQLEHTDYRASRLSALRVLPKMNLAVDVQLSAVDTDMASAAPDTVVEEVQVLGRYLPGNPIEIERISSSVVDSIDFTQIARFDDSMVSSALKRVVGVSMEDDRYAVVRGMKSRYQSTEFNGATLPSTDPARRDLPLDIFPAGIMQGLSLQKSATADVPSSATAGHISMETKDIPEEGFFKMSYSATRGDMHGDDMLMTSAEGDRDWLGMDDGTRDIPDLLVPTLGQWVDLDSGGPGYGGYDEELLTRMGQSLEHNAIYEGEAQSDSSISISGGDSWEIGEQRLGLIGAMRYANKWSNNTKERYYFSRYGDESVLNVVSQIHDTNNVIDLSAMLNFQWDIGHRHQLGLNNLALRHTTNSAEIDTQRGKHGGAQLDLEDPETNRAKLHTVDWIEEELLSHQLWGSHSLATGGGSGWAAYLGDLELDWQWMDSSTEYDRPNATQYTYRSTNLYSNLGLATGFGEHYNLWDVMEEGNSGYRLDMELPVEGIDGVSLAFKAGASDLQREREGHRYQYTLYHEAIRSELDLSEDFDPSHNKANPDPRLVFDPELFVGRPGANGIYLKGIGDLSPADDEGLIGSNYLVEQNFDAVYALVEADILEKFKVNIGVRKESFYLAGEQYKYTIEPMTELLDEERTSPSVGLTYLFSDAWQLRLAYSETVSWPEIFEVLPRQFRDIETLESYIGNPELKPSDIENIDMRLEWYPSETESVTLALFSKDITNAIENRFDRTGDIFDYYTFTNARTGEVYGAELDLRREFVLGRDQGHELFVQFNYTDITSSVTSEQGSDHFTREQERTLQGQPDYIANLQLGYDHVDTGQELTLVFNRKGEELAIVSPGGNSASSVSHVYEQPYDDLKLIYKKNFLNGLSVSLSAENLLDAEHSLEYEFQNLPYLKYSSGRKFKLKAGYSF